MKIETPFVQPMIRDAAKRYCAIVRINQSNRDPKQAQQFHVCHMFVHNYFKHQRPKYHSGKTISWSHFSDPSVRWALVDDDKFKFLRTKHGRATRLNAAQTWEEAPDEDASRHAASKFLLSHGVTGMAAPGIDGCGEPCGCGGRRSRHITGEACDLHGLDRLGHLIMAAEPGKYHDPVDAVDDFLHQHHLCRPMGHLKGNQQELWHVEVIPAYLRNFRSENLKIHLKQLSGYHGGC